MKRVLIFGDDEVSRFVDAHNGTTWKAAMYDLDQWLRGQIKYGDRNELQEARDMLHQIVYESGLSFDEDDVIAVSKRPHIYTSVDDTPHGAAAPAEPSDCIEEVGGENPPRAV